MSIYIYSVCVCRSNSYLRVLHAPRGGPFFIKKIFYLCFILTLAYCVPPEAVHLASESTLPILAGIDPP
jgi:hypothetical protein